LGNRTIKKVMLVVPPNVINPMYMVEKCYPPLGVAYIAAMLENDYDVMILDLTLHQKDSKGVAKEIAKFSPDVIGVSSMFTGLSRNAHDICGIAKSVDRDIITVMGGVHPTVLPGEAMRDLDVDYAVRGEAEITFPRMLGALNEGQSVGSIDSVCCRADGQNVISPVVNYTDDLDALPLPAFHLLDFEGYMSSENKDLLYTTMKSRCGVMITSRGCPAKCTFCAADSRGGRKFRARSPSNVLDEIAHLIDKWGIEEVIFWDDNLTLDRDRASRIFDGIVSRRFNISWQAGNGLAIYALDKRLLVKMKESGCYRVILAVESGVQQVLTDLIKKPLSLKRVETVTADAKELGFETIGLFVIGFPRETMGQIRQTVEYAEMLDFDYTVFSLATPMPGSELLDDCSKHGLLVPDFSWENLNTSRGSIITDEFTPAELEGIRVMEWDRINFKTLEKKKRAAKILGLTLEELEERRSETRERIGAIAGQHGG
jgi:magnesium-protoporphyrin IX monomethyl ester (oxidative) cyclase